MVLIVSSTSIIGPTMTMAAIIASTLAMASTSRKVIAITLRKISMWVMIKSSIALVIVALIAIVLILALVYALILLTSTTQIVASKELTCILASIGSTSSGLTSINLIMVIIVSILIMVLIVLYLCWQIFQFLLRLFAFSSTSDLGCLGWAPLKGWGISISSLSSEWAICEYKPGTAVPLAKVGNVAVGGSHFLIISSDSHFIGCLLPSFVSNKVYLYYDGHCIYKFFPLRIFCLTEQ